MGNKVRRGKFSRRLLMPRVAYAAYSTVNALYPRQAYHYSTGSTTRTYVPRTKIAKICLRDHHLTSVSSRCHQGTSHPSVLPQKTFVLPLPFLWWLATPTRSWHLKILFSCVDSHSLQKGEFSRASQFRGIRTFIFSRNPHWVCLSFHLGTFSSYVDLYEIFFILYSGS